MCQHKRTDRNHHRSSIFVLVFSVQRENRNPPPKTTTLSLLSVSPPSSLIFLDSRRIETHHRSSVFSRFDPPSSLVSIVDLKFYELLPYLLGVLGIFTVVTMFAVAVTEECRKIKLQYYGFKLASASASASREGSPITEVEPYIPFNINPAGMQPVLTTTYLLAFPSILASIVGSPFLLHVKDILNPESTVGAPPWVYYSVYAFFVFLFNIFDIECRKIKLQYYGFKLASASASASREGSPITEVEPYIPFNINPAGMQPVLTTTYLLAFPSILASIVGSPFLLHVKEILNLKAQSGHRHGFTTQSMRFSCFSSTSLTL
ncbi:hypothetical protein F2Q69_00032296 [Brassica cretica]|uniref:Uncharacterized protein n=1 Tax=Brassica cretica TaxID=69181 RepID=A0A8S9S7J0_BRACR|nr:hypothetical protein F2Q69_00032296 [Brassica cretica]